MQKLTWQMPFPPTSLVQMVAAPTVPHFDMQSESDSAARVTCKNNIIINLSQKDHARKIIFTNEPFEEE